MVCMWGGMGAPAGVAAEDQGEAVVRGSRGGGMFGAMRGELLRLLRDPHQRCLSACSCAHLAVLPSPLAAVP